MSVPEIYTLKELNGIFKRSRTTIYRWRRDDPNFPIHFKQSAEGRSKVFLASDVEAYVRQRYKEGRGL